MRGTGVGTRARTIAGVVVAVLAAACALAPAAAAKTFKVTTGADHEPDGCTAADCTLREALIAANRRAGADVIVLRSGRAHTLAIAGRGEDEAALGDLDVRDRVEIRASGKRRA